MKTADAPHIAMDEIREFLASHGLELLKGHFTGYSSGGLVRAEHLKKAMENYELYSVTCHPIGKPKEATARFIERPTIEGLRIQWADDSND